jgi:uncharacterized protein YecT (DUF1311 family)
MSRRFALCPALAVLAFVHVSTTTSAAAEADCAKASDADACFGALVADAVEAMNKKLEAVTASMKGDPTLAGEFQSSQASWENYRDRACEFVWNMRDSDPRQLADSEECELILTRERLDLLDRISRGTR